MVIFQDLMLFCTNETFTNLCIILILIHNYYLALINILEGCICFISLADTNVSLQVLLFLTLIIKSARTGGVHRAFLDFEAKLLSLPIFTHTMLALIATGTHPLLPN